MGMSGDWTPGPWSVPGPPDKVCAEGYTKNGWAKAVATVHMPTWMHAAEPWANAHLIAAAPDLYAALEAVAATIDPAALIEDDHPQRDQAEALLQAIAALAKARGETK